MERNAKQDFANEGYSSFQRNKQRISWTPGTFLNKKHNRELLLELCRVPLIPVQFFLSRVQFDILRTGYETKENCFVGTPSAPYSSFFPSIQFENKIQKQRELFCWNRPRSPLTVLSFTSTVCHLENIIQRELLCYSVRVVSSYSSFIYELLYTV